MTYRHSPGGLLDSLEDNEGWRQDFLYDAVGRLSAIQAPGGGQANFIFDAGGRLRETAMPNGYRSLYRYTAGGDLEELVNRAAGGAEVSHHTYSYDAQGRRKTHLEAIAGTSTDYSYQYDTLDRLREVRTQNGATLAEAYAYDAYGNRRERTAPDGSVRRYLYDAAQQLTQVRSGSDTGAILAGYSYDDAGNQTQRSGTATLTLAYDALDRLASASGTGIAAESYRYDHQDRRIETVTNGTPKRFVYAGQELLSEYGTDWSAAQAHYAYAGLDHPLLRNTPSGNAYYHADGLGSVVATSNAAGSITANARYDAFGQTLAKTGSIPRYGYTGREPDQTGLIYYRARYYDPGLGRFGQRDPAGFADGINPYAYVGNNPISFSDPLGLMKSVPSVVAPSAYVGSGSNGSVMASLRNAAQTGLNFLSPGGESFTNARANYKAGNNSQAALWAIQGGLEFAAAGVTGGGSQVLKGVGLGTVKNLNANNAISNFGVYEIYVKDVLEKVGKADLSRITQSSGLPTRLHQQLRKLENLFGKEEVSGSVVENLGTTTTAAAKAAEKAWIDRVVKQTGKVPPGNEKSYKP